MMNGRESEAHIISRNCSHCRGIRYIFMPWFERVLEAQGLQMSHIPADILKIIPPQYFIYCHCNPRIVLLNRKFTACKDCNGTTWRFSEIAEHQGYFYRKIRSLSWQHIAELPCQYFERCSCGHEPKSHEERELNLGTGTPSATYEDLSVRNAQKNKKTESAEAGKLQKVCFIR